MLDPDCTLIPLAGDDHSWALAVMSQARRLGRLAEYIDRGEVYRAHDGICALCGDPVGEKWTIDHIIPLSRGGDHIPSNVQLAHFYCNLSKGNREKPSSRPGERNIDVAPTVIMVDGEPRPIAEYTDIAQELTAYLTTAEAAALTGAAVSTWTNRARAGLVPGAVRRGAQWLLPRASVLAFAPWPTGRPRDPEPSPAALYRRRWRERRGI